MNSPSLLRARRLKKRFGGVTALDDVSLDIRAGEVHAICGENGAGKSTLINILGGIYPSGEFEGTLSLNGTTTAFGGVNDAEQAGVVVVHQELTLFDTLSVAENLFLPRLPTRGVWLDHARLQANAAEVLRRIAPDLGIEQPVSSLGVGEKQLLEIGRGCAKSPRVLILDEPTSALSELEVERLFQTIIDLRRQGVAIVYISHKLDEVMALADHVSVLRDGRMVFTGPRQQVTRDELVRHMVGREISSQYPPRVPTVRDEAPLLRVEHLTAEAPGQRRRLLDISFTVYPGEIVGLAGMMGSGRSELLMHLFGIWGRRVSGEVHVGGQSYNRASPHESIRRGMMFVPEDRKELGLCLHESVLRNLSLSSFDEVARWHGVDTVAEYQRGVRVCESVRTAPSRLNLPVATLSGGNQQKIVIGRGVLTRPSLIVLDEPMRGIDVGAKREIFDLVSTLAGEGKAILLVSSELPEITEICDRILVVHQGAIAAEFRDRPFAHDAIVAAATQSVD